MNTLLILDKDAKTGLSEDLKEQLLGILKGKAHPVEVVELGRDDVMPCLGCFRCFTKQVGICATRDRITEFRDHANRYDLTIFLTPVTFGHFSATVKCAIDRGCGGHNRQVIVGYGDDLDDEEQSTFIDLTRKHRGKADIVHPGLGKQVDVYLATTAADSQSICEAFKQSI